MEEETERLLDSLNVAIEQNDGESFKSILRTFENLGLNLKLDQNGYSPLHVAVINRRQEMLERLLERKDALGLDVNIRSRTKSESWTAWQYATRYNYKEEIVLLIVKSDCDTSNGPAGKYSSSKICEKAVNSIYDRVVDELNSTAIVPKLVKRDVLTSDDVQRIILQPSSRERAMLLLSLIPRKGNDDYSYRELFSALKNDKEHRPHHSLGEDLDEICQRLMEEEQKKRYTEDKKSKKKGLTSARGSFTHVQTIYTGSDPHTTPTTLDSTCTSSSSRQSSRPDSGFQSQAHTPLDPSSGEHSVDSQRKSGGGREDCQAKNDQASNFNDTHVMGQQEQRKQYHVISSVTKSKFKPFSPNEEEGTIGCGSRMFVGSGRAMVQHGNPFVAKLSIVPEDDRYLYSDTERDGCQPSLLADHKKAGRPRFVQEHRSLTQVMECAYSNTERSHTHRIDVCPKQHVTNSDISSTQSTPPITIPSKKHLSASLASKLKVTPDQNSSSSSSSECSVSPVVSASSSQADSESSESDHSNSAAAEPKIKMLHYPSRWEQFKERVKTYITSNIQSQELETNKMPLGLKMI